MHGVGGQSALRVLHLAGFDDVHSVASQFTPDLDFPTVAFPNPEEPGATDALLALAARVGADIAIALDPDADRCAVGIPTIAGWRMLSGEKPVGCWAITSSRRCHRDKLRSAWSPAAWSLPAAGRDRRRPRRPPRADPHRFQVAGPRRRRDSWATLVYAYEEAIGHCVDPAAVRDKDGISATVLACDLVATIGQQGFSVSDALDRLALRYGVHSTETLSRRVDDPEQAAALMARLRAQPPTELAGFPVTVADSLEARGPQRTDALILTGGDEQTSVRVVVRPSGTEPKVKCYTEVRRAVSDELTTARRAAADIQKQLLDTARGW